MYAEGRKRVGEKGQKERERILTLANSSDMALSPGDPNSYSRPDLVRTFFKLILLYNLYRSLWTAKLFYKIGKNSLILSVS